MSEIVRRSKLIVPLDDQEFLERALKCGADTIVLDLATAPASAGDNITGSAAGDVAQLFAGSGTDIFVLIGHDYTQSDLEQCVQPGIDGVVFPGAEAAAEINGLDKALRELERQRNIPEGTLQIDVVVGTARGIWDVFELVGASPRVISVNHDLTGLAADLNIQPTNEVDQFAYARGRLVVAARSREDLGSIVTPPGKPLVGIQPHGLGFLGASAGNMSDAQRWLEAAKTGYIYGFKGAFCTDPDQVEYFNKGFSPPEEDVSQARKIYEEAMAKDAGSAGADGAFLAPMIEEAKTLLDRVADIQKKEKLKNGPGLPEDK